jgi:hypothetical protein
MVQGDLMRQVPHAPEHSMPAQSGPAFLHSWSLPVVGPVGPAILGLLLAILALPSGVAGQEVQSPEAFFGYQMGADRELAHWDELADYYRHLDEASPRLTAVGMGPSTWGNPFIVLFVSAPENLERLDELQALNRILTDPRGRTDTEVERAVRDGVAIVSQSFGLHSSEVSGSQTAAELAWELVTRDDEMMHEILRNTLSIIFPSLNPDGTGMIAEWYREHVGTEYEGSAMPWLYHPYIGHNNNRDAFMQNTIESMYAGRLLFRDWVPQAFIDHHEMGGSSARFYIPPYAEPIRPDGDPLVWWEMAWYGGHIGTRADEAGIQGVTNYSMFSGWGHFGFHWITPFHNIAGMLTESARTGRMATPVYLHPDQLEGNRRALEVYEPQVNFPNPWPGGWWRLRDIVEQQKLSAIAALELAALNREQVLRNAHRKAVRQTDRGERAEPISYGVDGPVAAFVIPADQHDPLTARKLLHRLLLQGIEVHEAQSPFEHEGRSYEAGSWVVSMAQPKRGVVRWLLGSNIYPDNRFTRDRDGNPIRPYDLSTHTMAEFMGVTVHRARTHLEDVSLSRVEWDLEDVRGTPVPPGQVVVGPDGYLVEGRQNAAFRAVNLLFDEGIRVARVDDPGRTGLAPGDFVVEGDAPEEALIRIARDTGVDFFPLHETPDAAPRPVERRRVGMYHRYYGGNMDEGWTRMMLEDFGFPYDSILDAGMTRENLAANYDVVILPNDQLGTMLGRDEPDFGLGSNVPPEYWSGFGEEGVEALDAFVRGGGTLLTFASAGDLPIQRFGLPVWNVLAGLSSGEFWDPGMTLRARVDASHPAAYGMPEDAIILFGIQQGPNQAYEVPIHDHNERVEPVVTFGDRDLLQSGWIVGEEHLAGRAAMVTVRHGEGRVVLVGFRPQHRGQTHGTLKFVFNSLLSWPE